MCGSTAPESGEARHLECSGRTMEEMRKRRAHAAKQWV